MYQVGISAEGEEFVGPSAKTFTRAKHIAEGYLAEPAKHDSASTNAVFILTPDGKKIFPPFVI